MLRKQVDGLALMVSLVSSMYFIITHLLDIPPMFDANTLQGMNDAVLQLWSREMKIMQIK